jgi:hypothetical protein
MKDMIGALYATAEDDGAGTDSRDMRKIDALARDLALLRLRGALSGQTDEPGTTATSARRHDDLSAPSLLDQGALPIEPDARRTLDFRAYRNARQGALPARADARPRPRGRWSML